MSSLAAKARFNRLGGPQGTAQVTPTPGVTPLGTSASVPLTIVDPTTARVAAVTDNNNIIEFTNATGPITYTILAYAEVPLPVGALIMGQQGDEGQMEFVAGAGVTFETSDSYKTRARESFVAMKHTSLNNWKALGDLEASIAALSVLGRYVNSAGRVAAIEATADLQVLMRRASELVFDALDVSDVDGLVAALAAKADVTYVDSALAALVDSSPGTLDTLNELAAALGDDPNFAATMTTLIGTKASIVSVQQGASLFAVAGGTANALTATLTPVPTLADGMQIHVRATAANSTTTPTLAVNGGTARTITKLGGQALLVGDIYGTGHELNLRYRASVPRWELLNPVATVAPVLAGTIGAVFDGGGEPIEAGMEAETFVPFGFTITAVRMLADQIGNAVVDVWVAAVAGYPPIDGNSITAAAPATLTADNESVNSMLTGWTVTHAAGVVVKFHVDSVSAVERLSVLLVVTKS